jgi:hypothetical protein
MISTDAHPRTFSSCDLMPTETDSSTVAEPAATTSYTSCGLRCFCGAYPSSVFHKARTMAAIFLASVTLARLGLVPPASSRW